ncbi:MAG: twin-arginine translocation signal domain-containing protein [Elusimicrobia bacterium]|nr:twin-arginine translocation signal domain-containing protein [Elusimicrobiota bacterium]
MAPTRRKFLKGCFAAAGAAVLGCLGLIRPKAKAATTLPPDPHIYGDPSTYGTNSPRAPRYLELERSGELARREQTLWAMLEKCRLCPRNCDVNRLAGRRGACSTGAEFRVASHGPHFGEEAPLVGRRGSGTIFFSNCSLLCVFCQNWQIAHRGDGRETTHAQLADMMIDLQRRGVHNINLVTPTHLIPHIIRSVRLAIPRGLNLPILYNTGGYESMEVMRLLDGIVSVYLPDFKVQNNDLAVRFFNGARDYVEHTSAAIKEMHRQVGTLRSSRGAAYQGLLIRHLIMPENTAGTDEFVRWVVRELGPETHVNIMGQYRPMFQAAQFPPLNRRITPAEYNQAMRWARQAGLRNFH